MGVVEAKVSGQSQSLHDFMENKVGEQVKSSVSRRSIEKKKLEPSMNWKNAGLSVLRR